MSKKRNGDTVIKRSRRREIWRLFRKNRPAMIGLVMLIFIILVAIFADVIVPYEKALEVSSDWLQPPSAEHIFGTDNVGRDLFARVVHGSRYSLVIGIVATALALAVGAFIGAACGYFGGWLDNVIMRLFDVIASIPGMLLILVLVMALGQSVENLLWALMISGVPGYAALCARDRAEPVRHGLRPVRPQLRHRQFPHNHEARAAQCLGPIIIMFAGSVSGTILAAASYSFMGFGVQQPTPEWGAIISASRGYMRNALWLRSYRASPSYSLR